MVIEFEPEKVNVITGWSETGKSAVVAIIDYVLGSGTCAIPVGVIRDTVSWYGLTFETDVGLFRVARRKPEQRQVSSDYWVQQGPDALSPLPSRPSRTSSDSAFRASMDTLSGLSNLRLSAEENPGGWNERASFRDMAAFNFLPQHIVANPYTLFFKADTSQHREKLRNILPLVLGAVTSEDLILMHRLEALRRQERQISNDLRRLRGGVELWRSNATGQYYRAQELGLLPSGEPPRELNAIIQGLARVVQQAGRNELPADGRRTGRAMERLADIQRQERKLDREIGDARRRLKRLQGLSSTIGGYDDVLADQESRVKGAGWFADMIHNEASCAVCGSTTDAAKRKLDELRSSLHDLEDLTIAADRTRPMVDREIIEIEQVLANQEQELLSLRRKRLELEFEAEQERGAGQRLEDIFRFIGNVEQALRGIREIEGDKGLESKLSDIQREISSLEGRLEARRRDPIEEIAMQRISKGIQHYADAMGIEAANGTPTLDKRELNVKFVTKGGRTDFLWEIGSGQNWMGYHIATFLAIHGVLLNRGQENPVPSFLVIDQPSQVYFPSDTYDERVGSSAIADQESSRRELSRLGDLERTRRIFETLDKASRENKGRLQIIVLEHADQKAWGGIKQIHEVRNWRGDADYLVPKAWII